MPQLAPINWLFLYILFWAAVALASSLIWWMFKPSYITPVMSSENLSNSKSMWKW